MKSIIVLPKFLFRFNVSLKEIEGSSPYCLETTYALTLATRLLLSIDSPSSPFIGIVPRFLVIFLPSQVFSKVFPIQCLILPHLPFCAIMSVSPKKDHFYIAQKGSSLFWANIKKVVKKGLWALTTVRSTQSVF